MEGLNVFIIVLLIISVVLIFLSIRKKPNKWFFLMIGEITLLTAIAFAFAEAYIITVVWFIISSVFFFISTYLNKAY